MVSPSSRFNLSSLGCTISTVPQMPSDHNGASPARPAILQVVPSLETGGAERSSIEIAAALVRAGFAAPVASRGGRMVRELEEAGGEWIPLAVDAKAPHRLLANAVLLRSIIRIRNIKLIHARSRAPAWSSLWAARMTGIPFVTTYHG